MVISPPSALAAAKQLGVEPGVSLLRGYVRGKSRRKQQAGEAGCLELTVQWRLPFGRFVDLITTPLTTAVESPRA